jgi:ornithine carbamoyltransferase
MTRNFLDLDQVPAEELRNILTRASQIKVAREGQSKLTLDTDQPLTGKIVALIFEKPSTRTRISFDVGIRQMGGRRLPTRRGSSAVMSMRS